MCKRQGSLTGLASPNTDSSDDKPQEARGVGIRTKHKSKLRIGGQIATGNPLPCPLDGDFAPHTRIIASLMRLVHCVHSKALDALRKEL